MTDTQQQPFTYPMPQSPVSAVAATRPRWFQRRALQLVAAAVAGLAVGAVAAGDTSDLEAQLAAANSQIEKADAATDDAMGRVATAEQAAAEAQTRADATVPVKVAAALAPQKAAVEKERIRLGGVRDELGKTKQTLDARARALTDRAKELDARAAAIGAAEVAYEANTIPGDGLYEVGVDIRPGIYKASAADSGNCYFARLGSLDTFDIIDNNNTSGPVTIIVKSSDVALDLSGCNDFHKTG